MRRRSPSSGPCRLEFLEHRGQDALGVAALFRDFPEPGAQAGQDRRHVHPAFSRPATSAGALLESEPERGQRGRALRHGRDELADALCRPAGLP